MNFFLQCRISMCYHWSVDPIKIIHCEIASESFYPSLFLFLFDWWTKMWEITKEVSMNYNGLYLLHHTNSQMHMYTIALSIKIINKCNVSVMYRFKSAMMVSCWTLYVHVFLSCDLSIQLLLKSYQVGSMID